jgi:excisionase family DNA binding protein
MRDAIRWLTIQEAAHRACCGPKTIRQAVRSGRLQAAYIGRRRELRFLETWIEEWLIGQLMPEDRDVDVAIDAAPSGSRKLSWR